MIIDRKNRDEKLQLTEEQQKYQHYQIDKYEYLTGEEVLPSDQNKIIERTTCSPLRKAFQKHGKTCD